MVVVRLFKTLHNLLYNSIIKGNTVCYYHERKGFRMRTNASQFRYTFINRETETTLTQS